MKIKGNKWNKIKRISYLNANEMGFTLIELILVITVLGILAVSALPTFYDVSSNAKQSSRDGILGAVNSGIALYKSNALVNGISPVVPATLDSVPVSTQCSTTNPCFTNVITGGIADGKWSTGAAANTYEWRESSGATPTTYTYNPATESFQ